MKTELAVSFIFDLARGDELDRIGQIINFARTRGVIVRGDLERLAEAGKALRDGHYTCPKCQRQFLNKVACRNHIYICEGRPYVHCELGCGETHEDTLQGRGQHRRFRHPKEDSCAV